MINNMIMNAVTTTNTNTPTSSDLQICPASPDTDHETFGTRNIQPITTIIPRHQNPKKKRTKMIKVRNTKAISASGGGGLGPSGSHSGIVKRKKPDPNAPKITRPCTECGKKFWSWKALFGHMRCHPERTWRGINPPPNLIHRQVHNDFIHVTTKEDEYAVACLLMLANSPAFSEKNDHNTNISTSYTHHSGSQDMLAIEPFRFDLNCPAPMQDDHAACSSADLDLSYLYQV